MASNMIAFSGAKLAAVGAQGTAVSRQRGFAPTAGCFLPVAGQGSASFPLRWSAATRVSPLPQRAKSGEAREGSQEERDEYKVHNFVSSWAQRMIHVLLSVEPCQDVEATAKLERHFSQLSSTAKSEGDQLDRAAAVRGMIAGAYRLIELAYKSYNCPRVSAQTTEEVFVDYFISFGYKASESSMEFAYKMKQFQVPEADQLYLGSMMAAINLAKAVVHGLRKEPYIIAHMFAPLDEEDLKGFKDSPFPNEFPWTGIYY